MSSLRIIFMGSPEFCLPTLEVLKELSLMPKLLMTQPDRPAGRGQKVKAPAVKVWGQKHHIPLIQPEKLDLKAAEQIQAEKPDLGIVVAYGKLLKENVLKIPRFGCINIHASLLPRLRGAAPIQWAIMNGDKETGISIQKMILDLDAGPVLYQRAIPLGPMLTGGELHDQLSLLAAESLKEFLHQWDKKSELKGAMQNEAQATYASKLTAEHFQISWNSPVEKIERQIRAFSPVPGARALTDTGEVFKILSGQMGLERLKPGVIKVTGERAFVGTQGRAYEVLEMQPPGGKAMSVASFLRGRNLPLAFKVAD